MKKIYTFNSHVKKDGKKTRVEQDDEKIYMRIVGPI